jgi:hypothetical protein
MATDVGFSDPYVGALWVDWRPCCIIHQLEMPCMIAATMSSGDPIFRRLDSSQFIFSDWNVDQKSMRAYGL